MERIEALRKLVFEKKSLDGYLVTNGRNQLYFAGFPGTACILIPKKAKSTIYVYSTNYEQAKAEGKDFNVELIKRGENLAERIAKKVKASKINNFSLDAISGVPSVADYMKLRRAIRGIAKIRIDNKPVSELRKVKDKKEIELMRKAGELTSQGMKVAYETIKPGVEEYDVAAEIEYAMRKKGSYGTAFETIVASGDRSAFPHGGCTHRKIQRGDLVVVDIGASYEYYCSDMTRTIAAGKPSAKQKKIHEIVRLAQEKAFQTVRNKAAAKVIDKIARNIIEDAGYGEYFVHNLGHGVGLEVHEPPGLSPESKEKLAAGNVVTIEPGVYLVGFGGVRIEDTVLVQKRRAEKLTKGSYALEANA